MVKPAGLTSIPGRGENDSVLEMLGRQLGLPSSGENDPRIRVVHRLDKDTSGVMVFAKNTATQRHLSFQFQNNTISKEYLALVVGRPLTSEGEINAPLGPDERAKQRMCVHKHGRPARTLWKIERQFRSLTLLRVFPKTGKTHQIRVHLKSIGLPLAIDPIYNPPAPGTSGRIMLSQFKRSYRLGRGEEERPLMGRLTLHAEKLKFVDVDGKEVEVTAPLPKDFRATLNMLEKYGA